jgi:aspartate/methionine/tyrosine aminotransferase
LYPGYGPIFEFTEALINWYEDRFGVSVNPDQLYPTTGGKDAIAHLAMAILDAGDEVLVPDPGYPAFAGTALMLNAKPVSYNLTPDRAYLPNVRELHQLVTDHTKAIWVNYPSNPVGQVASLEQLKPLLDFAYKHDIWLLYDNPYAEITFDGFKAPSILELPGGFAKCVELGSFSKTFSFAGYRMGWAVGNEDLIKALAKVKSQVDSGLSKPLQQLGAYALTNFDHDWYDNMLKSYRSRRDTIAEYLLRQLAERRPLPVGANPRRLQGF